MTAPVFKRRPFAARRVFQAAWTAFAASVAASLAASAAMLAIRFAPEGVPAALSWAVSAAGFVRIAAGCMAIASFAAMAAVGLPRIAARLAA